VTPSDTAVLLERFRQGKANFDSVLDAFNEESVRDLGFASIDLSRECRKGFPEVIYGAGKTVTQTVSIAGTIFRSSGRVMITRVSEAQAKAISRKFRSACHHEAARCITLEKKPLPKRPGYVAVVTAGTSDISVAEEAAVTAGFMGNEVRRIFDVGVAGIHRLFRRLEEIRAANVVICVAGMEGALPSVIGGLVSKPVIGVPTSVGYGANFGGLSALLGMLNSCSSGLTVVNIDNGFGAGYAASQINELAVSRTTAS